MGYCHEASKGTDKGIYYQNLNLNDIYNDPTYLSRNSIEFDSVKERLKENGYIELHSGFMINLTFEGLLYYEKTYLSPYDYYYINIISIILEIFTSIEQGEIILENNILHLDTIQTELQENDYDLTKKTIFDILTFIKLKTTLAKNFNFKGIGYSEEVLIFRLDLPILTPKGRDFLEFHKTAKNILKNVRNDAKELLLEEYFEIFHLWKRKKWREIAIKMGSILECLITDFIEKNRESYRTQGLNPPNINSSFHEKLLFIIRNQLIGDPNDWNYVDSVIKDYRNLIHLYNVIDRHLTMNEEIINLLRPYFEKLIQLF